MARTLRPGQRAQLFTVNATTGERSLVTESRDLLFEAPNWTRDGWLIVNGDGRLFRISVDGGEFQEIDLGGPPLTNKPDLNNDHVLSPSGDTAYVSSDDGHLYAVSLTGAREPRRVSNDRGASFRYYLHGVSPDGTHLAYIGLEILGDRVRTNVFTIPAAGGPDVQLTNEDAPHDGSEFSPDGAWIYFNSERGSTVPGHAQLFRMSVDGEDLEQLTFDERVNWFPHVSPDGSRLAYISYPPGTLGHPADLDVIIRITDADGAGVRDLVHLFGGQGTLNVNSWDPSGTRLAYVAYPLD